MKVCVKVGLQVAVKTASRSSPELESLVSAIAADILARRSPGLPRAASSALKIYAL